MKKSIIIQKILLIVFGITTFCLVGKAAQLLVLYSYKPNLSPVEWSNVFTIPSYAKYMFIIQIASLIAYLVVSRISKHNQM